MVSGAYASGRFWGEKVVQAGAACKAEGHGTLLSGFLQGQQNAGHSHLSYGQVGHDQRLDVARDRRVSAKRHVRPLALVIGHVLTDQTQQMALSKHDD
ncbi:MAG TPA: hypothetical protein VGY54_25590 [Polyangiaceae bacterium]|jgi:hypothetical protein|nr:hypothetical protein [Polyangiaceae bacterium]